MGEGYQEVEAAYGPPPSTARRGRVLLVERRGSTREDARLALTHAGFDVEASETALERLQAFAPDVAVCEVGPATGGSGFEKLAQLRAHAPFIPVVVRGEVLEPDQSVEAMRRGAFGCVLKSSDTRVLAKEVKAAMAHSRETEDGRQRALELVYQQSLERKVAASTAELVALQREHGRAEKLSALGTLLAGVVHELNAPLTVLDIDLQLLERLPAGGPAAARALVGAQQAKERIARLCTTLRRLSQVGEAKDWSAMEPAVEACKALCLPQLPEGVSLSFALDPTVREVWLGQDDLLSVMSNLVLNSAHALEARPGGGSIWVTLVRHGPRAVLSVRDDGAGIEAQNLARVLDPFFTTRGSKGTGLGLSLVDQIVRSAGGGLTIDSTWGEGTTVSVVLRVI